MRAQNYSYRHPQHYRTVAGPVPLSFAVMARTIDIRVTPETAAVEAQLAAYLRREAAHDGPYEILRRSIDSRQRQVMIALRIALRAPGETPVRDLSPTVFGDVSDRPSAVVIGAGPAGLFAALSLIRAGIRPLVFDRGKNVKDRRRDLVAIHRQAQVNPDSNYCFGEGGAGTFSDGKLYTRSHKRGDIEEVLRWFVQFGASPDILVDAHPHIGTNKLPGIISAMRDKIIACGGEVHFGQRLSALQALSGRRSARLVFTDTGTGAGREVESRHVILATGHSARDVFALLVQAGIAIEFKPFALGVRVEHPQALIDSLQYHCATRGDYLPPAAYQLVHNDGAANAYSFCMCPGGIIAPCATAPGEVVTNGWSPSRRNNPWANSGMVVPVDWKAVAAYHAAGPLAGVAFQQAVEVRCWEAAGSTQAVPAQRLTDFLAGKTSSSLPACSYQPGIVSARVDSLLPPFISLSLQQAFAAFGRKMPGFLTPEAVVVAPESRTSAPVRIPRVTGSFRHPDFPFLLPCGEGAGYAGGIVSAAMDGIHCARAVAAGIGVAD